MPHTLISDNRLQFDSKAFKRYCGELGIRNRFFTLACPQSNGQAKATSKVIVDGLKKRLDETKGKWVDELHHVLWAYRTTPRLSTREMPFLMTCGSEAVIPLKASFPMMKMDQFDSRKNEQLVCASLDLAEEKRELTT